MAKRIALVFLIAAGCTGQVPPGATPSGPAAPVPTAADPAAAPLQLTRYDGGDFAIGVPGGWEQVAKDQPLTKSVNRCTFRLNGADGSTSALLIVTSSHSPGAVLAEQVDLLKAATRQQGETITAESQTEAGDSFGLRSTSESPAGPMTNYRFVAIGGDTLFLIGLSTRQGGPVTDGEALRIIESFATP